MKIIHTADLHLGHIFYQYTRYAEHQHFLDWLLQQLAREQADVLIVSGDIYDTHNPSAEAQRMFYDFLLQAVEENEGLQVVVIAGNHDSGARLEAAAELLHRHNIYVRGTVPRTALGEIDFARLVLPLAPRGQQEAALLCYALPFLRSFDYAAGMSTEQGVKYYLDEMDRWVKQSDFKGLPVAVAAHLYAAGARLAESEHSERIVVGGQDMVSGAVFSRHYAYTALGHIHKAQGVDERDNVRYAGSPLPLSFGERDYLHSVVSVEIDERGKAEYRLLDYAPLVRLRRIPEQGMATPEKLLSLLSALPAAEGDRETWPYLEVHVQVEQPEPQLRHQLAETVRDKAVRFCRIVPSTRSKRTESSDALPTLEGALQQLQPIDIAQRFYEERFGQPMPESLVGRFHQAQNSLSSAE